jgi:hypothetical protein
MRNQACNWATMWGEEAEMRKNDILEYRSYFPHISNGISGEFPGRVLSLSGASAPVVNLHVHISFSLAFPDKP